ncbi:MAG: nucleotidyltransferase domain-containing protein [bacterium]|nr:nucleotidyltransferase domain-containing protein [bacterium]
MAVVKTKDRLNQIVRQYIDILRDNVNLYAVIIFGSYAKGTPGEYSDIDMAIFSEDFGWNPLKEMKMLCQLRRKVDTDIEPLPFPRKDFFEHASADFVAEILQNGKIVYQDGKIRL